MTKADLQSVLDKLKTQNANAEQALDILSCCSYARFDENQNTVVQNIWNQLKNQNENFSIQHYNCMLSFTRQEGNKQLAEEIFAEIEKNDIKPDA